MNIKIKLSAYNQPTVRISVNGVVYSELTLHDQSTNIEFDADLQDSNQLSIEHFGKINQHTVCDEAGQIISDRAAELVSITIGKYEIPRNILFKQPFAVKWPQNLVEDAERENRTLPDCLYNNLYFGFNGTYTFDFARDLRKDYYYYFWQMERDANHNLQMVDEASNTGYFEAYGMKLEINKSFDLTIHDLKYIIENQSLPEKTQS
jgi:hypothetical protein